MEEPLIQMSAAQECASLLTARTGARAHDEGHERCLFKVADGRGYLVGVELRETSKTEQLIRHERPVLNSFPSVDVRERLPH